MKRLELGGLTGGGYGLRISRPGFDVTSPTAPLLFDTDMQLMSALATGTVAASYSRVVTSTNPPYGLPGNVTTSFTQTSVFTFPFALPFAPVCKVGFTVSIGGALKSFDEGYSQGVKYISSTTSVSITINQGEPGNVDYDSAPIHRVTVMNVPRA